MNLKLKKSIWCQNVRHKIVFLLICLTFIIILNNRPTSTSDIRTCFLSNKINNNGKAVLNDILIDERKPVVGKTIFFHETSCRQNKGFRITARQACAVESAALHNPNMDVYVLFAASIYATNNSNMPLMDALMTYSNVYFRSVNLWTYAANTPVFDWLKSGKLFESKYVLSHVSDFLRYLTLWKWGGTYLDLDVIVKKSFENIKPNYAGAESSNYVAAGVINLDHNSFGHEIADLCLRDFQVNFNGNEWGTNGPGVITRVLQKICKTKVPFLMTRKRCLGFKVYPLKSFYAVRWWNWKYFFEEKYLNETLKLTKNSIAVHAWNKNSNEEIVKVGSNVAYSLFAQKYCPKVYKTSGAYF